MICLSSLKPLGSSVETDFNQIAAWHSWQKVFSHHIYWNAPERELSSPNTIFLPSAPFPHIWEFVELAAYQKNWCAIVNSDIIVSPNINRAMLAAKAKHAMAVTSWRHEFDPSVGINAHARVVDCGIDFFAASPEAWRIVWQYVPENIRIGCQQWDSWMLGALGELLGSRFMAITNHKCIFHPKHGNRKYGDIVGDVKMMRHSVWPHEI